MKIPAKAVDSSLVGIFAYITVKVRLEGAQWMTFPRSAIDWMTSIPASLLILSAEPSSFRIPASFVCSRAMYFVQSVGIIVPYTVILSGSKPASSGPFPLASLVIFFAFSTNSSHDQGFDASVEGSSIPFCSSSSLL